MSQGEGRGRETRVRPERSVHQAIRAGPRQHLVQHVRREPERQALIGRARRMADAVRPARREEQRLRRLGQHLDGAREVLDEDPAHRQDDPIRLAILDRARRRPRRAARDVADGHDVAVEEGVRGEGHVRECSADRTTPSGPTLCVQPGDREAPERRRRSRPGGRRLILLLARTGRTA